jgi:hypothetical protein
MIMRLVKARNFLHTLGEHVRPKTAEERRIKAFWTGVVMMGVVIAWGLYTYITA